VGYWSAGGTGRLASAPFQNRQFVANVRRGTLRRPESNGIARLSDVRERRLWVYSTVGTGEHYGPKPECKAWEADGELFCIDWIAEKAKEIWEWMRLRESMK
jgi:hypothetical protein